MLEDYRRAWRLGQKQVQADAAAGRYPYPPALDDILKDEGYQGEIPLGTMEIDLALIAGTRTRGRRNSFSSTFMPLPEPSSEFASKWSDLIDSQRVEGIREPVIAYEFLQRFYVQEGNKRVSVLRYLGQPTILAQVTRVVPMPSDSREYRLYQEFMRFYAVAPIYGIVLAEEGDYERLAACAGQDLEHPWPQETVRELRSAFDTFVTVFRRHHGESLGITAGSAFLIYLKIFGFEEAVSALPSEVDAHLERLWGEFVIARNGGRVAYLEDPSTTHAAIIPELKKLYTQTVHAKPFRVAFIYEYNPLTDGWTALHDHGRKFLERHLGSSVSTHAYLDCEPDLDFDLAVQDALAAKADLVVTIAPTQMHQALHAAVAHPECSFINCSVSLSHSAVRTFSARLYEVKFLLGALAATMAPNHRIGYVAGMPVYGTVSEINAFAIGAQMIDPEATVYLKWFSAKDCDWKRELVEADVHIVSASDYPDPLHPDEAWGLYRAEDDGSTTRLAEPAWHWGRYYQLIVKSIRNEAWRKEATEQADSALNYWWGITAGVVDVRVHDAVPSAQRTLIEVLRQAVLTRRVDPFAGALTSQEGPVQDAGGGRLSSAEIVRMRWLNHNVVGRLPLQYELSEAGLEQVEVSGLIPVNMATLPHRGTVS